MLLLSPVTTQEDRVGAVPGRWGEKALCGRNLGSGAPGEEAPCKYLCREQRSELSPAGGWLGLWVCALPPLPAAHGSAAAGAPRNLISFATQGQRDQVEADGAISPARPSSPSLVAAGVPWDRTEKSPLQGLETSAGLLGARAQAPFGDPHPRVPLVRCTLEESGLKLISWSHHTLSPLSSTTA